MRKVFLSFVLLFTTIFLSSVAIFVSFFGDGAKKVHTLSRFWALCQLKASRITVQVEGLENLASPPYTLMCNHQSALDIFVLLFALPLPFRWIAKQELFRIPFVGWTMKRAGYISLDRQNPREALKAIEDAARKIRAGASVIIFPEGTRSEDGRLLPFKKGGFTLALKANVPIVPIGICGTTKLHPKGSFVPDRQGVVSIRIGEPIQLTGERGAKTRVMDEVREDIERLMACQET